jgi:hypothetical protein
VWQFIYKVALDILKGIFSSITILLAKLNSVLKQVFIDLVCPQLERIDNSYLSSFLGFEN